MEQATTKITGVHGIIPVSNTSHAVGERNSQFFIVDGHKVRVNFLPQKSAEGTMRNLQKTFLANGCTG